MIWKKSKTNTQLNQWIDNVSTTLAEIHSVAGEFINNDDKGKLDKAFTTIRLMFNRYAKNKKEV